MRKFIILILCLFVLTGCNNAVNMNDYDSIFKTFLGKETSLVNVYSKGYKYYLPSGVKLVKSNNYNEKLQYDDSYYYMFVDMVSYYYGTKIDYTIDPSLYYSNVLEYNDTLGYVEISKEDDLYRIKVYYNYASIETYVREEDIGKNLINISCILNSLKFNDVVVKSTIEGEDVSLSEETFDFYTPRNEGKFIDYINEYDEYEEVSDENNIGNEGNE